MNLTKGLTKIVNVCNKYGVDYSLLSVECEYKGDTINGNAIEIGNHYFIAYQGMVIVKRKNDVIYCYTLKNQNMALCYIFGYNNVLPNNCIVVDLDEESGKILGYTVSEEIQNGIVPCGTIQEEEEETKVNVDTYHDIITNEIYALNPYNDNDGEEIELFMLDGDKLIYSHSISLYDFETFCKYMDTYSINADHIYIHIPQEKKQYFSEKTIQDIIIDLKLEVTPYPKPITQEEKEFLANYKIIEKEIELLECELDNEEMTFQETQEKQKNTINYKVNYLL